MSGLGSNDGERVRLLSSVHIIDAASSAPGVSAWYDKPIMSERSLNTACARNTLWMLLVVVPSIITFLGYLMINVGNAPPDEEDQSALTRFLATTLGMFTAAMISAGTNFIFTAIPMHEGAYHSALKEDSWSARNVAKLALATVGGIGSGVNYIPLMQKVVPQLMINLNIDNKAFKASAEGMAYAFIATMMLLNIRAIYNIVFEVITPKVMKFQSEYAKEIAERRALGGAQNCVSAIVPAIKATAGIKTVYTAIEDAGVLIASAFVGGFYYTQIAKYISAENKAGGFAAISLNAAYGICLGDLAFGLFFSGDGFEAMLEGIKDIGENRSVASIINKSIFGLAAFTWSLFTIIPAMAQGQPGISKDLMALTSVVFNFPASIRVVNALAELALLNPKNALHALYKTADTNLEEDALHPGFNTAHTFASLRNNGYARLCARRQGFETLPEQAI